MTDIVPPTVDRSAEADHEADDGSIDHEPRGLSWAKVAGLVAAMTFLGGAIGWFVAQRGADPLNRVDVGFMQDMNFHHDQATTMSLLLLHKPGIDQELRDFAQEFIIAQRFEQGVFNATLDRYGHASMPSERGRSSMGWMGPPVPRDQMEGLMSDKEMARLEAASGDQAAALFIAMMTEHHLGGLHMADYAARHGHDETTRNLALAIVKHQRDEVLDLNRYRQRRDLPIPKGYRDPIGDQRLRPLSLDDAIEAGKN